MNGAKDLFAKCMMSIGSVGGDEGCETMTLKEGFV